MPDKNYVAIAKRYAEGVVSGKIIACEWVKKACQRQIGDLKRWSKSGPYRFDSKKANRICQFAEGLPHIKGEWARRGEKLKLEPWQCFVYTTIFGWVSRESGLRRFRIAYLEVARKNAKSTISAPVGIYMLCADNEPGAEIYCVDPSVRVLSGDFSWRSAGEMRDGDSILAFDEWTPPGARIYRKLRSAIITSTKRIQQPCCKITFEDGRIIIASDDHRWLSAEQGEESRQWIKTRDLHPGSEIRDLGMPWDNDNSREGGYLAGVFDGEACFHQSKNGKDGQGSGFRITFAQKPGSVMDYTLALCKSMGFAVSPIRTHSSGVDTFEIRGFYNCARFLGIIRPKRLLEKALKWADGKQPNRRVLNNGVPKNAIVRAIEYIGMREVVAIGTSTKTLFAEGLFSHNSAATTRDQAKVVWEAAKIMVEREPGLREVFGVDTSAHSIYQASSASRFQALSAEGNSLDGLNIHCGIVDELHAHRTRKVYDVLETARGARQQPLLWLITTAGFDRSGICYEQRTYLTKILDRVVNDETYWGIIYTLDPDDDWRDTAVWTKANPNLNVSVYESELKPLAQKAASMPSALSNFLTKHMSVWVNASSNLFNVTQWNELANSELTPDEFIDDPCWIGLDFAPRNDFTAIVQLFKRQVDGEDHYYVFARHYLSEGKIEEAENSSYEGWAREGHITTNPGNETDERMIQEELIDICRYGFQIRELDCDYSRVQGIQHVVKDAVGLLDEQLVDIPQNPKNLCPATERLSALIASGKIHHDGDPVLSWQLSNVVGKPRGNWGLYPGKERYENKIDGVQALLTALSRAMVGEVEETMGPIRVMSIHA
jgi:phage terminase large subunit-like protein